MQFSCLLGKPKRKLVLQLRYTPHFQTFWLQFVLARPLGQIFLKYTAIVFCISLNIFCLALFVFWMESIEFTIHVIYGSLYFPHTFLDNILGEIILYHKI